MRFQRKYATPEEAREARRVRNRIASKRRKAAAAIAAGREPGRVGGPPKYRTKLEKLQASRERTARWRAKNIEKVRKDDREKRQAIRRERAIAEGREPGRVGRVRVLSDAQRRDNSAANIRRWRKENPEKARKAANRNYEQNKTRVRTRVRERRLKLKISGDHSAQDILDLWEAQKRKCVFCLKGVRWGKFEVDHHVPLSRGGSNDRSNLRILHPYCNRSKGARDPADHAIRNGLLCW